LGSRAIDVQITRICTITGDAVNDPAAGRKNGDFMIRVYRLGVRRNLLEAIQDGAAGL
jgi:hypothetical protein